MIRLVQCFFVSLLLTSIAFSAETAPVEQVAAEYFRAMQKDGLQATAVFMHTDALASFKKKLAPIFEIEAQRANPRITHAILGRGATLETYTDTSPVQLMKSFMTLVDRTVLVSDFKIKNIELLGTVNEADVRHVLARVSLTSAAVPNKKMQVVSFKLERDQWRALLTSELNGIAEGLIGAVNSEQTGNK